MADFERFEFTVPGYTPETMPLDRLIEYLNQLMVILGNPSDLHLVDIETGSTKPVLLARHDVARKVRGRAREVWSGGGPARAQDAFRRVRRMVAEDGGKPAILASKKVTILEFQGDEIAENQIVPSVRQPTTINGKLVRIGGTSEYAQALVEDFSGNVIAGCTVDRGQAARLGALLYKPVQLHGIGSWSRDEKGKWQLARFHVQSFDPLEDAPIDDVLREAAEAVSHWPDDLHEQLLGMREDAA